MATRAEKSGINKDIQDQLAKKYDRELAAECMKWISEQIGEAFNTSGEASNMHHQLKSGQRLARLVNTISPGKISPKQVDGARMTFKQMELISKFIQECRVLGVPDHDYFTTFKGVPDHECFVTVDLYEEQNMNQVVLCIASLMRKFGLGPKEAQENKRQFTDEQLRAGQGVIGLQMGTNKGASQAGMSFGKARHIVD